MLDELVWRRLVDEAEQGRELSYEIAHPLIQEAIYERIGRRTQRAFHRLVARCSWPRATTARPPATSCAPPTW